MELFIQDEKTRLVKANPELLALNPYRELMRRLRKIEGDSDGREKVFNLRELAYVYYKAKFITTKEDEDKYKKLIGLPEDWQPDQVVLDCVEAYYQTQLTPAVETVKLIKESIAGLNEYIKQANTQMRSAVLGQARDINEFLDVLDRIPKTIDNLKKAEATLEREQEALAKGRKGRGLNKFEMPN